MIVTAQELKERYAHLSDPVGRIARDVKKGVLFPLVKGVYETDASVYGAHLAQVIYGPSYLSFDYVLYENGLIPEAVYRTFTCATYKKRKSKRYCNSFGIFLYRDVPATVFSLGVQAFEENGYSYQMATKEKALCDKLYTLPPVKSRTEFRALLFDDLRIDEEAFYSMDREALCTLAPLYRATNLYQLEKMIKEDASCSPF